jgi:hypothetical protein
LSLIADTAEEPLLCVVDDAQWLDRASARTLAFVGRRLLADPVGLVIAAREPSEDLKGLPELEVRGLSNGDARALLASAVPFRLDEDIRDQIVAETQGNPLALLELPRGLARRSSRADSGSCPDRGAGADRAELRAQNRDAAGDTRSCFLIAAAEPVGDPLLSGAPLIGAGRTRAFRLGRDRRTALDRRPSDLPPSPRALGRLRAAKPGTGSGAPGAAEATDPEQDPDRRAWHLAAAAAASTKTWPPSSNARRRAQSRGGIVAAAAFLERSVRSADPARRTDRALAARRRA